ncbi:MAG: glycosyltransferase family 39 protein [Polyangiaceae bacterium]
MTRFARHAAAIVAVKLLVVTSVLQRPGWFAISDDDFSRLAIAQQFAVAPRLDPSGTSWLPLPFQIYGTAFALFGLELSVARAVAVLLGVLGALGIYVAARWLRLSPPRALAAALIASVFPHSVSYAAATVPDYPTAVLTLLAVTSLANDTPRIRMLGALAALAATLCRYETWPVAVVVSALTLVDLRRTRKCSPTDARASSKATSVPQFALGMTAAIAPAGALAWLLHGYVRHHDPIFFVKRVTAYKLALGHEESALLERLTHQVRAFFVHEPELIVLAVFLFVALSCLGGRKALQGAAWKRPALALASVLAFLTWGDLTGGTPTHHDERVLLPLWFGVSLLIPELLGRVATETRRFSFAKPAALIGIFGFVVATTAWFVRPVVVPVEPFVDRGPELEVGAQLRRAVPAGERVAVYTEDYGYFAMEAALGRPGFLKPLHKRDPRHPELDPLSNPALLATRLDALGARYFVVPTTHRQKTKAVGQELLVTRGFALLRRAPTVVASTGT